MNFPEMLITVFFKTSPLRNFEDEAISKTQANIGKALADAAESKNISEICAHG